MKIIRAALLAIGATLLVVPIALAQWPTTCVDLNDIVEAHLGNTQNVGIYQKVFGDQAEQACQNDHREDVRSVFAWAIGDDERATQPVSSVVEYTFEGSGNHLETDRVHIKAGRYIVSTQQEHCIIAYLSETGDIHTYPLQGIIATNCNSGERIVTMDEGEYRLVVTNIRSPNSEWKITMTLDN